MKPVSVSELNRYVKMMLDEDAFLSDLSVSGELSNVRKTGRGHLYFSLKEEKNGEQNCVRCVMFAGSAQYLLFEPRDGVKVVVHGHCSLYAADGSFQLYCDRMTEDGIGKLYEEFEKLKKKLEAEGLFSPAHKKIIPFLPNRIGVITSPGGAVIRDIMNVTGRRFPGMEIRLYSCPVQGKDAPPQIIQAIRDACRENVCDVLILARGGGSFEDLWCFNDEALARVIYDCPLPIISAVGHETDFSISDFVADLRAPTPSAAAELAVPERAKLAADLNALRNRLSGFASSTLMLQREKIERLKRSGALMRPLLLTEGRRQNLDVAAGRLAALLSDSAARRIDALRRIEARFASADVRKTVSDSRVRLMNAANYIASEGRVGLESKRAELRSLTSKLEAMNPALVLARGYSIVEKNGRPVKSEGEIAAGDEFKVVMSDGSFAAERK
ncbi:MAG: exodeoxyribonuclease VII large subunit [Clostridia bacterium]|nr:exodeoxyribonuclease VII large subunit [Clostridia bacterium]